MFITTFNTLPLNDIPISETSWSDKAWALLFLIIIMTFVFAIYDSWWKTDNGLISKRDYDLYRRKKEQSYFRAAMNGLPWNSLVSADTDFTDINQKYADIHSLDQNLDWHSEVKELLTMLSNQYRISDDEWYSQKNTYLSHYSNQTILVYCVHDFPERKDISNIVQYFEGMAGENISKVIVAIKNSSSIKDCEELNDTLIEYKTKEELLNNLVNFEDYFNYIKTQFNETEVTRGDSLALKDIYVASSAELLDLKNDSKGSPVDDIESYLLDWAKDTDCEKQISLLGEYGQGKSVLSIKLAYEMIQQKYARVPIIIELRGKSPRNETITTIIASWALSFNYNVLAIQKLLQEGRLLIILEGFDELDMVGNSHRRLEHFKRLWEFARYQKSKIIITGRPNLFLDNQEARNYLHLNNDSSDLFYSQAIHLKPFNLSQISNSLRSIEPRVQSEILAFIETQGKSSNFFDLIARPSTLYQTSIIWDQLDKNTINSAAVIDEFIRHAFRRQAEKLRDIGPTGIEPSVLTAKEREYFMIGCAVGMIHENGYSNQITGINLKDIVTKLYYEAPKIISMDHSTGLALRQRLWDDQDAIESVFNDVRTAGILVKDLTRADSFKFAHKSFLEFLFAKYFVGYITKSENEIVMNSISTALNLDGKVFSLKYSDEVISHITETLLQNIENKKNKKAIATTILNMINPSLAIIDKIYFSKVLGIPKDLFAILIAIAISYVITFSFDIPLGLSPNFSGVDALILMLSFYFGTKFFLSFNKSASYEIWSATCNRLQFDYKKDCVISEPMQIFYEQFMGMLKDYSSRQNSLLFKLAALINLR